MNKNAIQLFTQWAKIQLTSAIKQKAFEYGITEQYIDNSISIINGKVLSKTEQKQRETLIEKIKEDGYKQVIEEVAYTWFNRFIALRFMEVNGFLPTRVRVFSDENNEFNPQILKEALTIELDNVNRDLVIEYLDKNNTEDLYKYLLICQCNALNKIIPVLFEKISNYSELLFPDNLLKKNSIIEHLVTDIPEEDWKEQVQILGWIYQFYVSSNREEFRKAKVVKKEHVPTLSQIFTPDWIVKYMTENSLGRLWLESYPNSSLKQDMKYYIEDAKQEEDVQRKLDEIKYKNVNPEEIKIIEPCCGSGHILCYIFDLLYKIYEESGYRKSEIPSLILEKNIYGLDIDKRASQLAYFSLLMKARSVDSRFFNREKIAKPKVLEIIDTQNIHNDDYIQIMKNNKFTDKTIATAKYLVNTFKNAKVIGSLLKVDTLDYKSFIDEVKAKRKEGSTDLFSEAFYSDILPILLKLARLAIVMIKKYDVMITNPPYLGSSSLEPACKDYANRYYPNSKADMFAMFMEVEFVKKNGFRAIVNPDSWMFLSTYENLRVNIFNTGTFIVLAHLGLGVFDAMVRTVSFIQRNMNCNFNGTYFRLVDFKNKEVELLKPESKNKYYLKNKFNILPGSPVAFWISNNFFNTFETGKPMSKYVTSKQGLATANNDLFLRLWFEVDRNKLALWEYTAQNLNTCKKWIPYNKGGERKNWYGNYDYVVNWENNGYDIKHNFDEKGKLRSRPQNTDYYLREAITWNDITTGGFSIRYRTKGSIHDITGMSAFSDNTETLKMLLGLMATKLSNHYFNVLNPTVHLQIGNFNSFPVISFDKEKNYIIEIVDECINLSKINWDSFETSWDFIKHNLVSGTLIETTFNKYYLLNLSMIEKVRVNEEKLNEFFITHYKLTGELNPNVSKDDITLTEISKESEIKSLISYIIGLNLGRYSLEVEGLVYAGGDFDWSKYETIIPDKDNIIPICDDEYFEDDLCGKVINSIKKIYGEDTLEENLQFIANALGGNGTSREVLRNYLLNDFYKDHLKIYQKRPIYWMFDSGKKNGFKALIYMHRYSPDLLAKMRTDYVHEQQERYRTQIENLSNEVLHLEGANKLKMAKKLEKIKAQFEELLVFEEKLHHLADQMIDIDLDDGVKVNYTKFDGILSPIK